MIRLRLTGLLLIALPLIASGCCSVPSCGSGACGMNTCSTGSCSTGTCGSGGGGGGLASMLACQGACGDVYVDEWISEPPAPDNCGYACGGCGSCEQCQPIRNVLKLLWGTPYNACCPNDMVGGSCGGCDSCDGPSHLAGYETGGYSSGSSCNCGSPEHHHGGTTMMREIPSDGGARMLQQAPEAVVPTPAPEVDPMASHLNPARRRVVRTASATR